KGTRARARLFHALITDNFDSELELQKQALTLNMPIGVGYVAVVCTLIVGHREGARGGDSLAEVVASLELPRGAISHTTDPTTLVILWPAESSGAADGARDFVMGLNAEATARSGSARARVRAGIGGFHAGLRGVSRSYLEAQQAIEAGRKLRPEAIVHSHDEVIPYLVLTQNALLADRFVRDSLGPLLDPATRNRAQLAETLESFLATGAVKDAATALNLHRHTVLYRLERVKELLGVDLDVPANRLRLQLALDLRRLL
ncbi:MAG TPA: helix-turn-helix domain-containing protein, partial [Candidatus Dormibacteraeota bacterium]|nr:helix-turn-helix domain-containing protein [Candidatus Dormibacteraeota bacterium]